MNFNQRVSLTHHGEVALLRIDNPPVNAVSSRVVAGLEGVIDAVESDPGVEALVLSCAGRTFVAGGDVTEFNDPNFSAVPFNRALARLEALDRPVVAALHGTVLGGGLERHLPVTGASPRPALSSAFRRSSPGCCQARSARNACRAWSASNRPSR